MEMTLIKSWTTKYHRHLLLPADDQAFGLDNQLQRRASLEVSAKTLLPNSLRMTQL